MSPLFRAEVAAARTRLAAHLAPIPVEPFEAATYNTSAEIRSAEVSPGKRKEM